MTATVRKLALTVHLVASLGWIGAVLAYLALDLTVATSDDPAALRGAYVAMDVIVRQVVVPLALASLLTGVLMGLGTRWGLLRHYWVVVSLLLTAVAVVVLLVEVRVVADLAAYASDPSTADAQLRGLPSTLLHSAGGLLILLVVTVLNVYKPQGLTRLGRRKHRAERAR